MADDDRPSRLGAHAAEAAGRDSVERAWRELTRDPSRHPEQVGFTRARIERSLEIVVAAGSALMGAQALTLAWQVQAGGWAWLPILIAVFASLSAMVVACVIGRGAVLFSRIFACAFPTALVLWAFGIGANDFPPDKAPWPYFLLAVATAAAIVSTPFGVQFASAIGVPVLFAAGRIWRGQGAADYWVQAWYDVSIAMLLALGFVIIAWLLRRVADGVDDARTSAVESYSLATAAEAAERERIEVAGLMHDSVLAALLAGARAESARERALAITMAREALNRLADAEQEVAVGTNEPVGIDRIAADIGEEARLVAPELRVELAGGRAPHIPARAARAIVLASAQAVANAVEHAGGRGLRVVVAPLSGGVRVRVSDTGPGFDLDAVPADRLGIRGSIFARVAAAGGVVDIDTSRAGTSVDIAYERPDERAAPTKPIAVQDQGERP